MNKTTLFRWSLPASLAAMAGCSSAPIPDDSFESSTEAVSTPYVGCYTDDDNRALPAFQGSGYGLQACVDRCRTQGYAYSGSQWFGECWCGDSVGHSKDSDAACDTPCPDGVGSCGGAWHNSIYETGGGAGGGGGPDTLPTNGVLLPGQSIRSGGTTLTYQADNHLVLYQNGSAVWASWQDLGATPSYFAMNSDCNAVLYDRVQNLYTGDWSTLAAWDSRTGGKGASCYARVTDGDWFICSGSTRVWSARGGGRCDGDTAVTYVNTQQSTETWSGVQFPFRYCSMLGSLSSECSFVCDYVGGINPGKMDVKVLRGSRTIRTGQARDIYGNVSPNRVIIGDQNSPPTSFCWQLTGRDCVDQFWRLPEWNQPRC